MIVSIVGTVILPPYNYSKIDLTKDENKIGLIESVNYTTYTNDSGNNVDFHFTLFNLTESAIEDINIYIVLRDSNNNNENFSTETPIRLESRIEVEQNLTGLCNDLSYNNITIAYSIGDGETVELRLIDNMVEDNGIVTILSVLFFVFLIAVIVLSVRANKIAKKLADVEAEAYQKRADDIVDLEVRAAEVAVRQQEKELGIERPLIDGQTPQNVKITCAYCGCQNDEHNEKCSVCGAIIKK